MPQRKRTKNTKRGLESDLLFFAKKRTAPFGTVLCDFKLFSLRSSNRANTLASTALYASISVDNILAVAF